MQTLYQSLVAVEPLTLIAQICNLFIQLYIFKRFLLDKVIAVLDQRRQAADKEISDAQAAHQEAMEIKQTYLQNMKDAQATADKLLSNAQAAANARGEEIINAAQQTAVQIKQKAEADINQEKKKALNDAKNEISEMALAIAGKVVGRELTVADQGNLIDHFINELGDEV